MGYRQLFYFLHGVVALGAGIALVWTRWYGPDLGSILMGLACFYVGLLIYALVLPLVIVQGWRHLRWWERFSGCVLEAAAAFLVSWAVVEVLCGAGR